MFLPPCSQAVTLRSRYRGAGGVPGRPRHLMAGVPARPHRRRMGGAACARAGQALCGSRIAHGRSPARGTAHRRRGRLTGPDAVGHHRSELSAHSANLRQASPICILGSRPCRPRRMFRSARRLRLCAGPPPAFRSADRAAGDELAWAVNPCRSTRTWPRARVLAMRTLHAGLRVSDPAAVTRVLYRRRLHGGRDRPGDGIRQPEHAPAAGDAFVTIELVHDPARGTDGIGAGITKADFARAGRTWIPVGLSLTAQCLPGPSCAAYGQIVTTPARPVAATHGHRS